MTIKLTPAQQSAIRDCWEGCMSFDEALGAASLYGAAEPIKSEARELWASPDAQFDAE